MGLYRHRGASSGLRRRIDDARLRRRINRWTSVGVAVLLSLCVIVVTLRQDLALDDTIGIREDGRQPRLLGDSVYPTDPLIHQPHHMARPYMIIFHIILLSYMLLGLNTVCDLYFTGALDEMVNKWDIKPDVAGATFMAAGGSAPELFTSLIGALLESDVGFGTIVGSAVFNVLFVIGVCGFVAKEPIKLTWWPLFRDCTYYIFGLSVLALFAKTGGKIELWEAFILFICYVGYCGLMYYNPQLERWALTSKANQVTGFGQVTPVAPVADTGSTHDFHHIKKSQPHFERKMTVTLHREHHSHDDRSHFDDCDGHTHHHTESGHDHHHHHHHQKEDKIPDVGAESSTSTSTTSQDSEEEDDIEALLLMPDSTCAQVIWALCLPIYGPLYYLTAKPSERSFMLTFIQSLFWIAGFSYFLVYCVKNVGEVLGIHIIVMGFTLLAAGTSIPDLVSSMAVARAGEGDMAVSSSIGSNIFDILIGLPIPWILKILFVEMAVEQQKYYAVPILSKYIVMYVLLLIFMVFCVIVSIHFLKWHLSKPLGLGMAALYAIFLAIVLTVEFSKPKALMW